MKFLKRKRYKRYLISLSNDCKISIWDVLLGLQLARAYFLFSSAQPIRPLHQDSMIHYETQPKSHSILTNTVISKCWGNTIIGILFFWACATVLFLCTRCQKLPHNSGDEAQTSFSKFVFWILFNYRWLRTHFWLVLCLKVPIDKSCQRASL